MGTQAVAHLSVLLALAAVAAVPMPRQQAQAVRAASPAAVLEVEAHPSRAARRQQAAQEGRAS